MSHTQQSSIRSFFQPRRRPEYAAPPLSAAPPGSSTNVATSTTSPPPPPAPAPPPAAAKPVTVPITLPPNGVPVLPSPPSLPSGASIVPLAEHHIPALRRINSLLLPVPYPDSFYARILDPFASGLFSRAILWQDSDADTPKVIGGLVCRLEPNPFLDTQGQPLSHPSPPSHPQKPSSAPHNTPYHAIYIQSLALLSPYRSLGLAAAALEHIIASAALLPAAGSSVDARTIYAHVWTENDEGLKWYQARGFAREGREPVKGYYFKLRPDTAWVVRRHIGENAPASAPGMVSSAVVNAAATPPPSTATQQAVTSSSTKPANVLAAAINLPPITSQPQFQPPISPPPAPSASPSAPPPSTTTPTTAPPPPRSTSNNSSSRPSPSPAPSAASLSFQNTRPETEWNDLPADMVTPNPSALSRSSSQQQFLSPPGAAGNGSNGNNGNNGGRAGSSPASGASSRSSSAAPRKRRERAYPSAAFGGQ